MQNPGSETFATRALIKKRPGVLGLSRLSSASGNAVLNCHARDQEGHQRLEEISGAGQAPASSSPRQWAGTPGLLFAVVEKGSPVAPRLGNVLYVLACVLAVLILALGATVFFLADPSSKAGQNPIAVLVVSVVVAVLIWLIGECLRYILAGTSTHAKPEQFEERLATLDQRIDALDTRLTRYEETVGPQLKTLGSLLHQALSKRDRASHSG